ncbi:MAG TPA: NIPSNAP family protein [Candidatus Latescibacteria bacterium]|jgi:hypothetical protein|nr:NIPSNAP family protein [Candidatus Latescibacterota bacterium]|tara:strand:+ start:1067 stop:1390 length:324 start_codon:yes stop_codon:yes gene_type:complete
MVYELRTYIAPAGRLDDIVDRFRTRTMDIFARHGFDVVGFWTVDEGGDNELVYLLRFASPEASEAAWSAFRADPEWIETRKVTEANGPIVDEIIAKTMTATEFSPLQ